MSGSNKKGIISLIHYPDNNHSFQKYLNLLKNKIVAKKKVVIHLDHHSLSHIIKDNPIEVHLQLEKISIQEIITEDLLMRNKQSKLLMEERVYVL
mgnify:CR=1 FL=1